MHVKRTLAVVAASAAVAVGSVAAVGLSAMPAHAVGTVTAVTLPLSGFSHLVLDPAHQHVFISSAASNEILVTDYSGNTVATIANEPGADGLVLSSDGSAVYAALHRRRGLRDKHQRAHRNRPLLHRHRHPGRPG